MPTTIASGGEVRKDPADEAVFRFDWDAHLAAGVAITSSSFAIACPTEAPALLTKDSESQPTTRTTQLRLKAGTAGKQYQVTNAIVTNENPTQKKERSFFVDVEEL